MPTRCAVLILIVAALVPVLVLALGVPAAAGPNPAALAGPASYDWEIGPVDAPHYYEYLTGQNLRLDAAGRPHLVYGGDALYHAWHDGSAWQVEVVDSAPGAGAYAALAFDGQGRPHISYYDSTLQALKFAHWTGAAWSTETVGPTTWSGNCTSIALDPDGHPHITYIDAPNGDLKYARWTGTDWALETVAKVGSSTGDRFSSIALDSSGRAHICYSDMTAGGEIKYARWTGAEWEIEIIGRGYRASVVLYAAGLPHVGYCDESIWDQPRVRYARRTAGGWVFETVYQDAGGQHSTAALALDALGRPHLAYYDYTHRQLCYTHHTGSAWETNVVFTEPKDTEVYGVLDLAIALDPSGAPLISYREMWSRDLICARLQGEVWSLQTVDPQDSAGAYASLALDAQGRPHIAYQRPNIGYKHPPTVAYAHLQAGAWVTETVSGADRVGSEHSLSLALDAAGSPQIICDGWSGLHYLQRTAGGWQDEVIPTTANAYPAALAVGTDGTPYVAYYDHTPPEYRLAKRVEGAWDVSTIEFSYGSGADIALALNGAQQPCVSYFGLEPYELRYARWDGSQWLRQTVGRAGRAGWTSSLALDSAGNPHISYMGASNQDRRDLHYAHWTGTQWITETVDWVGPVTWSSSIAVDAAGRPHICYASKSGLKHAYRTGSAWVIQVIASGSDYDNVSLELDAAGNAHVAFRDRARRDLYYALGRLVVPAPSHWLHLPHVLRGG